ncbi:MAG: hypothetical protein ACR2P6_07270, partial [Gammaproteobacteria bacterium]
MQQSLSLFSCDTNDVDEPRQNRAAPACVDAHAHLWLCLYFHALPLEVLSEAADQPCAVCVDQRQQSRILNCNRAAAELGVRPGLPVNAALALAP